MFCNLFEKFDFEVCVTFFTLDIQNGSIFISLMGISSALGKVAFGAICTFFRATPFNVLVVAQV